MKILITGAAGSLGRRLVEKLAANGDYQVFATDIKPNPFAHQPSVTYQLADLRDNRFFDWVTAIKPNRIVHLASVLQLSARMTREVAREIDVTATERLLKTSVESEVDKFVVTTSGAAYGYYPENKEVITEARPTRGNPEYFYSDHKAAVEQLMADYRQHQPQLKQIVFRPGAILGPNFEGPVVDLFQQKVLVGLLGYPGPFNFIWSDDVVDYIVEGLSSNITGQFNIAGDGLLSMKDIAKHLGKPYLALPEALVKLGLSIARPLGLTPFGPEQTRFIKYRPVLDNRLIKAQFQHQPSMNSTQVLDAFMSQFTASASSAASSKESS